MEPASNSQADAQPVLRWSTPTHLPAERSVDWYWALGIIAIVGVLLSVWFGDVLFAAIIGLAAVMLGIMAARDPREHEIEINSHGVVVDNEFYPFESLYSFWIHSEGIPYPRLYLATSGIIHPHAAILMPSEDEADKVREYLSQFVKEEERHNVGTLFAHWLGF